MFSKTFIDAMTEDVFLEDTAGLHDAILSGNGKSLNDSELRDFFKTLPKELQLLALEWGVHDTQFRDDISICLKRGKI